MSKILKNKKIIVVFFLVNCFILNLAIGSISNYSANIFILKLVSTTLLLLLTFADIRINRIDIQKFLKENNPKKLIIILFLFIGYLSITLIYSHNTAYGAQKILNFLASTVPSIITFYYLIVTLTKERFKIFIFAIVIITIVTVTYILIDYPFDPSTNYEYRAGRWSHVIYGRIIGSIAVVLLLYMSSRRDLLQILLYSVLSAIAIYGLYLSSLRAGMLGVILCIVLSIFFLVYEMITKREMRNARGKPTQMRGKQLAGVLLTIILTISFIHLIPNPGIIDTRFDNLTQIEDLKFGGDEPINSRIEELRISKDLFLTHPIFGIGFGGFRSYNDFTEAVKYPHNLFVEMAVEGGVVGLGVLCIVLFVIFKSVYRFSKCHPEFISGSAFFFLLFALFLAMFSKELSNQGLLWIFLALIPINQKLVLRF